jgi:hypothetical protein
MFGTEELRTYLKFANGSSVLILACCCHFLQDLQNLTQRFKSKQTASVQQAMYWADRDALIPAAAAAQAAADASISNIKQHLGPDDLPAGASIHSSTSAADTSDPDISIAAAAAEPVVGEVGQSDMQDAASSSQQEQQHDMQGLAERAVRLSFAALQGVPEENPKVCAWSLFLLLGSVTVTVAWFKVYLNTPKCITWGLSSWLALWTVSYSWLSRHDHTLVSRTTLAHDFDCLATTHSYQIPGLRWYNQGCDRATLMLSMHAMCFPAGQTHACFLCTPAGPTEAAALLCESHEDK